MHHPRSVRGGLGARPVFGWYVKNYGAEVKLFVDDSQIVQLECLCCGTGAQRASGSSPIKGLKMAVDVRAKRIYDPPDPGDGYRVLIDRVWPRGVSRDRAHLDEWARELAPSTELRKWFNHEPARFDEFRRRYRDELAAHSERLHELRGRSANGRLTILYAARDREHNDAVVLTELLREV